MIIQLDTINVNDDLSSIVTIDDLLTWASNHNCSDLFIKIGDRPFINRYGTILRLDIPPISEITWDEWANQNISSENNAIYVREKMFDFAYDTGVNRYRINLSYSEGKKIMTARMISSIPPKFTENGGKISYPENAKEALRRCMTKSGMIVIGAPTGSGKSTTLASCINSWTDTALRNLNVITLEDPIEYKFNSNTNFRIIQKELGTDFLDFPHAIKSAMREHPNIIIVGESRDKATVNAAVDASKSGHTVCTTYHTKDISSTITRLLDNYAGEGYGGIDLIANLSLIICQRLRPNENNDGYILEGEFIELNKICKDEIINAIRTGQNLESAIDEIKNKTNYGTF